MRCYQHTKGYFIYEVFYENLMVTTKIQSRNLKPKKKKRGNGEKHYRKPPNQNGRQKHKEKETMGEESTQKTKD